MERVHETQMASKVLFLVQALAGGLVPSRCRDHRSSLRCKRVYEQLLGTRLSPRKLWLKFYNNHDSFQYGIYCSRRTQLLFFWTFVFFVQVPPVALSIYYIQRQVYGGDPYYMKCKEYVPCSECSFKADPDIVGIGVRLGIYLQTICLVIILGLSSAKSTLARAPTLLTGFTIIACASIADARGKLDMAHATMATWLLVTSMIPPWIVEPWMFRSPGLFCMAALRFIFYAVAQIRFTLQEPCIGSNPTCSRCVMPPTWVRVLAIIATLFSISIWLWGNFWRRGPLHLIGVFPALCSKKKQRDWNSFAVATVSTWRLDPLVLPLSKSLLQGSISRPRHMNKNTLVCYIYDERHVSDLIDMRQGFKSRLGKSLKVPRFQRMLLALMVCSVMIVFSEINAASVYIVGDRTSWGYGQLNSMFLAGPPVATVLKMAIKALQKPEELKEAPWRPETPKQAYKKRRVTQ
ncbi:hypothetical protein EDC01DRAFT_305242 [Geopyxis carbonaria]|nr:hypothetical protein EDC01DRAFT_305242 [Geopyxis carbonaria]